MTWSLNVLVIFTFSPFVFYNSPSLSVQSNYVLPLNHSLLLEQVTQNDHQQLPLEVSSDDGDTSHDVSIENLLVTQESTSSSSSPLLPQVMTESVDQVSPAQPSTGGKPSVKDLSYFDFSFIMLCIGLSSLVIASVILMMTARKTRSYIRLQELPVTISNPIYDRALSSLRNNDDNEIEPAIEAIDFQHSSWPLLPPETESTNE